MSFHYDTFDTLCSTGWLISLLRTFLPPRFYSTSSAAAGPRV